MANRGSSNRQAIPRRIRQILSLTEPLADSQRRGELRRLFKAAHEHAESVDRYILPGHGHRDAAQVEAEVEAQEAISAAAFHARRDTEKVKHRAEQKTKLGAND